jgi:hypothetical protein
MQLINAVTGEVIAVLANNRELEAFDDQCADWRKVRDLAEVNPKFRDEFLAAHADQRWLVEID